MAMARLTALLLVSLVVACGDGSAAADSPAEAYWRLRARSEEAAAVVSYETSAGPALVYALPPARRLDVQRTVGGESVTIARFYRPDGTYVCDMTHRPRHCAVSDEPDGTPHAQPGEPSMTVIGRAPGRTIAGLPATCFSLVARADERLRREVCFSSAGVLLLVAATGSLDRPGDRIEASSVTAVHPEQLDPYH